MTPQSKDPSTKPVAVEYPLSSLAPLRRVVFSTDEPA